MKKSLCLLLALCSLGLALTLALGSCVDPQSALTPPDTTTPAPSMNGSTPEDSTAPPPSDTKTSADTSTDTKGETSTPSADTTTSPTEDTTTAPDEDTTTAPDDNTTTPDEETTTTPETEAHIHAYGEWTTSLAPSCTASGTKTRHCSCGESESQTIAPLGHSKTTQSAVAPTCSKSGLTEGSICSVCKTVFVKQQTIPATNSHNFSSNGYSYKCTTCSLTAVAYGRADGEMASKAGGVRYYVTKAGASYNIVIFGEGDMPSFSKTNLPLWYEYLPQTTKITIQSGVRSIGSYAFYCPDAKQSCTIEMADSVKSIGQYALYMKFGALTLGDGVETLAPSAVGNIDAIYIPKSLKKLNFGILGNETYFYEGTLEEFYELELYRYNKNVTVRSLIESLDETFISNIHIYYNAESITDRDNYWK